MPSTRVLRQFFMPALAAALLLTAVMPPPAFAHGNVTYLKPNGVDDTGQLQAALEACSGVWVPCRIELGAGVFHTDVLLVRHFNGRISGRGRGRTIIRPLAGVPLRSTEQVFLGDPTLANPYPVLLHFADGGDITLEDFALKFPADMLVSTWRVGVYPIENALISAVMVDGGATDRARLTVSRLDIRAAKTTVTDAYGSNVINAIRFEGQIRTTDPADDLGTATPLGRGELVAHDVTIRKTGIGFALRDARRLRVDISNNALTTQFIGMFLTDLGASHALVQGNQVASELLGIQWLRGIRAPAEPSHVTIVDNAIAINRLGNGMFGPGDGVVFADITVFEDPVSGGAIDTAWILRNRITLGVDAFDAVYVLGDRGHVTVADNQLSGPALDGGIVVLESRGTRIRRNTFSGFEPAPDVWLQDTTSACRVVEPGNTVLDDGSGNVVK